MHVRFCVALRGCAAAAAVVAVAAAAAATAGCKRSFPGVRVEICSTRTDVFALDVVSTLDNGRETTTRVSAAGGAVITFPASFDLTLAGARDGTANVSVSLLDAADVSLVSVSGPVTVARGEVSELYLNADSMACGDGTIDPGEACEPASGTTSCSDLGLWGGAAPCGCDCQLDTSGCYAAPVLRSPANSAEVGSVHVSDSLRPRFSWEAAAGSDSFLQYATDSAFSAGAVCVAATAPFVPAGDLAVETAAPPVGARYYWRVRSCAAGADGCAASPGGDCSDWTAAWYVDVGRTAHDFDGDGYADFLVGAPRADAGAFMNDGGLVQIFRGGPAPMFDAAVALSVDGGGLPASHFGQAVLAGCDFDGDGFGDFAIAMPFGGAGGIVRVYRGGATLDGGPDAEFDGVTGDKLGNSLGCAGDVDGDGFDDLLVGNAPGAVPWSVRVYHGDAQNLLRAMPDPVLTGTMGEAFGASLAGADVDCDGYSDVVVGSPAGAGGSTSRAVVYRSTAGALDPVGQDLGGGAAPGLGAALAVGDFNGDGFADVAAGAPAAMAPALGAVLLFRGGAGGPSPTPDETLDAGLQYFGATLSAGDLNGDGTTDLVAGIPTTERVLVFFGGQGTLAGPDHTISSPCLSDGFAKAAAVVGDLDADGAADIVVGDWLGTADPDGDCATNGDDFGRALVYFGGANGMPVDTVPRARISGPEALSYFGCAVAAPATSAPPSHVLGGPPARSRRRRRAAAFRAA